MSLLRLCVLISLSMLVACGGKKADQPPGNVGEAPLSKAAPAQIGAKTLPYMRRSVAIFERQGATVVPAPTDYHVTQADWDYYLTPSLQIQLTNLIPSSGDLDVTTSIIREYIGFAIYRMKGWL